MEQALIFLLFFVGIVFIVKGGSLFVDAAVWIAKVSGIPQFIIGATVVSIATTLPEIIVSVMAVFMGKTDMAVGNAIGSVTANVGLIMGIAVICMPFYISRKEFGTKSILMLLSGIVVFFFAKIGSFAFLSSVLLLFIFVFFVYDNIKSSKDQINQETQSVKDKKEIATNIGKFLLGTAGIVIGARFLVDNGSEIAKLIGVPENIIAVTIIAIGTSLPELVTTLTAIAKKQASLSIGNIIGANIIDMAIILPVCTLISGKALPISAHTTSIDLPVSLLIMAVAVLPTLVRSKIARWQGILMLSIYTVYIIAIF